MLSAFPDITVYLYFNELIKKLTKLTWTHRNVSLWDIILSQFHIVRGIHYSLDRTQHLPFPVSAIIFSSNM